MIKYMVYYWHNDGGVVIIQNGLTYQQAVRLAQINNSKGFSCEYAEESDKSLLSRNYRRF